MSIKIIKNITSGPFVAVSIDDIGRNLPAAEYEIPVEDYHLWANSSDAQTAIADDKILMNDGTADLTKAISKFYIAHAHDALSQRFQGNTLRGNGFADNLSTQAAIEAAKATGGGTTLLQWAFTKDQNSPFHSSTNANFTIQGYMRFPGTIILGTPTKIKMVLEVKSSGTGEVKIFDATNSLAIVTKEVTTAGFHVVELGALANLSPGEAVWEFQGRKITQEVHVASMEIIF